MTRNPFTLWDRFWFAPASAYPVAAFRALLGAFLVAYFLTFIPDVTLMFSNEGVYFPWLVPDYAPSPSIAWLIYLFTVAAMIAFSLGYRTSITTPLTLLAFLYHYFLSLAVKHSTFERLIIEWLVLLCFVQSDLVWSVRATATNRDDAAPTVDAWIGRLVRFQAVMLYLGAGLWKAANPGWRSGELLFATLQGMWSTDLGFWLVRTIPGPAGWALLSQLVIIGEILLGVLFCFRRTYALAIVGGIAFHVGNIIFLSIPEFLVCIAPYVFFLEPSTLQRWVDTLVTYARGLRARVTTTRQ